MTFQQNIDLISEKNQKELIYKTGWNACVKEVEKIHRHIYAIGSNSDALNDYRSFSVIDKALASIDIQRIDFHISNNASWLPVTQKLYYDTRNNRGHIMRTFIEGYGLREATDKAMQLEAQRICALTF